MLTPRLRLPAAAFALVAALLLTFAATAADHPGPTRILFIDTLGRENSPYDVFATHIRRELGERLSGPVAHYDLTLDGARFDVARDAHPYVHYLSERFARDKPDLVIPLGNLATTFYGAHRDALFPGVPMLVVAGQAPGMPAVPLAPGDASMPLQIDVPRLFAHILEVLPQTSTIAVVIGDSPIEREWAKVLRLLAQPVEARAAVVFLNTLPLDAIVQRVAALPEHSAILYTQMYADAAGVSQSAERTLRRLLAAANAPIFPLYASDLGDGTVGGPLLSERDAAVRVAGIARTMLANGPDAPPLVEPLLLAAPVYDWRALQRWQIPESRLPPGSTVLHRQPSLWEQHRSTVIVATGVAILQTLLLAGLLLQRARRRRAEDEALQLSGRILTAHEDERRSLARELHDDLTPRLARLAIEAARSERAERGRAGAAGAHSELSMHDELVHLSEDVHALSYRLHPTVLDDLGLVDALRSECEKASRGQAIRVDLAIGAVPERIPGDVALCLFRIAQEALRNVFRHAQASIARVSLVPRKGGLELTVVDDGAGFDPGRERDRPSLGHSSMRERVRQVGGELRIVSAPGSGTTVAAWAPLPAEAA